MPEKCEVTLLKAKIYHISGKHITFNTYPLNKEIFPQIEWTIEDIAISINQSQTKM